MNSLSFEHILSKVFSFYYILCLSSICNTLTYHINKFQQIVSKIYNPLLESEIVRNSLYIQLRYFLSKKCASLNRELQQLSFPIHFFVLFFQLSCFLLQTNFLSYFLNCFNRTLMIFDFSPRVLNP